MEHRRTLLLLVIFALAAVLLLAGCAQQGSSSKSGTKYNVTEKVKSPQEQHNETLAHVVADGVYNTQETYRYHAGTETVNISVTVKDDIITAASVVGNHPNMMSKRYIDGLNGALPDLVVGKRIDEIVIPHNVAGSSLTTAVFRQYVESLQQ